MVQVASVLFVVQRDHAYVKPVGLLSHDPVVAATLLPTFGDPVICGRVVLCGGTSACPSQLAPQQTALASVLIAHVW